LTLENGRHELDVCQPLELRWASVYDGHDGVEAAQLASTFLHEAVFTKLSALKQPGGGGGSSCAHPLNDATVERVMHEVTAYTQTYTPQTPRS
jgi:hypothetical protein